MRMTIDEIISEIEKDFYAVDSLRLKAHIAAEIKAIADKDTRAELAQRFTAKSGRDVTVWARIEKRFPALFDNSIDVCADGFIAASYMCQLPLDKSLDLFAARVTQLNEPNVHLSVLRDVNELKPRREKRAKPAPQPCATCAEILRIVNEYDAVRPGLMRPSAQHGAMIDDLRAALDGAGEVNNAN